MKFFTVPDIHSFIHSFVDDLYHWLWVFICFSQKRMVLYSFLIEKLRTFKGLAPVSYLFHSLFSSAHFSFHFKFAYFITRKNQLVNYLQFHVYLQHNTYKFGFWVSPFRCPSTLFTQIDSTSILVCCLNIFAQCIYYLWTYCGSLLLKNVFIWYFVPLFLSDGTFKLSLIEIAWQIQHQYYERKLEWELQYRFFHGKVT